MKKLSTFLAAIMVVGLSLTSVVSAKPVTQSAAALASPILNVSPMATDPGGAGGARPRMIAYETKAIIGATLTPTQYYLTLEESLDLAHGLSDNLGIQGIMTVLGVIPPYGSYLSIAYFMNVAQKTTMANTILSQRKKCIASGQKYMFIQDQLTYISESGTFTHSYSCEGWNSYSYKPFISGFKIYLSIY